MKFKTWDKVPGEMEARAVMDQFMRLVSEGRFLDAITLCPVFAFEKDVRKAGDLVMTPTADLAALVAEEMKKGLGPYLDEGPQEDWFQRITPPSKSNFKDFGFFAHPIPEGATGYVYNDVLGNVYFDHKVTDVTSIFSFVNLDGAWVLSFKMLKTM